MGREIARGCDRKFFSLEVLALTPINGVSLKIDGKIPAIQLERCTLRQAQPNTITHRKNIVMKPIKIRIFGVTHKSPQQICVEFLDTERWSEFQGYAILPGIEHAYFETKTSGWVGSRIKVQNTDGSSHIEEIIDWNMHNRMVLSLQEFNSPIQHLATHFVETWEFSQSAHGTDVTRTMTMYPKNTLGWLMLRPISRFMKKALEQHLVQLGCE